MAEMQVQAEVSTPAATVQIVQFVMSEPVDAVVTPADAYRLNLCLTSRPRNSRASFPEHWDAHRFEPIGKLFHLPPRQLMHVRSDAGANSSVVCALRPGFADRWLEDGVDWTGRRLEAGLDVASPHIRAILLRLAEEAHRPGFASKALIDYAAGELAIELGRFSRAAADGPVRGGLAAWRLRAVDERLLDTAVTPSLEELAGLCNLSVRQLTRGFRTSRGCSINAFIARTRVEAAKRMLLEEESIKAIAFAMGFASPSSFAYAFRRDVGVTPREFRQRMRGGMR